MGRAVINIAQGCADEWDVLIEDDNGPVDLTGYVVKTTVRDSPKLDGTELFTLASTDPAQIELLDQVATPGWVRLYFDPAHTAAVGEWYGNVLVKTPMLKWRHVRELDYTFLVEDSETEAL